MTVDRNEVTSRKIEPQDGVGILEVSHTIDQQHHETMVKTIEGHFD